MPPEDVSSTESITDAGPDLSAELEEMVGSGAPGGLPEPAAASASETMPALESPAPPAQPATIEEFDIDGRKVGKDALFQTYRQFSHLQGLHQQAKPFLDFMREELQLTPEQMPQFRSWVLKTLNRPDDAAPAATELPAIDAQPWFQEIAEVYPQFGAVLRDEILARQAAEARLQKIEESLTGYTTALTARQEQEQAFGILSKAGEIVTDMTKTYIPLQQADHRRAFLTWLWNEKRPTGAQLTDPDYVEGMYLRFNRDGIAQLLAAQAKESQQTHAATVARGFAETGAPRPASTGADDALTKELQAMMSV